MKPKTLLEKSGLTARDLIVILLILADIYLVATGHHELSVDANHLLAAQAAQCETRAK